MLPLPLYRHPIQFTYWFINELIPTPSETPHNVHSVTNIYSYHNYGCCFYTKVCIMAYSRSSHNDSVYLPLYKYDGRYNCEIIFIREAIIVTINFPLHISLSQLCRSIDQYIDSQVSSATMSSFSQCPLRDTKNSIIIHHSLMATILRAVCCIHFFFLK